MPHPAPTQDRLRALLAQAPDQTTEQLAAALGVSAHRVNTLAARMRLDTAEPRVKGLTNRWRLPAAGEVVEEIGGDSAACERIWTMYRDAGVPELGGLVEETAWVLARLAGVRS